MKNEINLLPHQMILSRERREYLGGFSRLLQRISLLILILLIGELVVYLAFLYINREISIAGDNLIANITATDIRQVNSFLADFERRANEQVVWSQLIEDILGQVPAGVTINKIEVLEKAPSVVAVTGSSNSQKKVSEFQTLLGKFPWVEKIEAPLQNYTLGPNASYSLSIYHQKNSHE